MSKLSLATVSNPENQTSFVNQLNNNFDSTETWSDSVLSRDGTSPNSMEADLDMNSNSILNLPAPTLSTEPLRLGDLPSLLPTIVVQNTEPGLAYTAGSLWIDSDSTDYDLYQLVAGVWTDTGVDLEGSTGATGATGATGPQGDSQEIFVQNDAPGTTGLEGSLWIDANSTDYDLYQLQSSTWVDTGVNLKGIQGIQGIQGEVGINWLGAWSAGTYNEFDAVENNGSSYVANTTTTNEPPHADWDLLAEAGEDGLGTGDVVGPAGGVVDNEIALFDSTTGKLIKGSGGAVLTNYLTTADAATTYQPLDGDLTSISALTTTAFGRSLLELADETALEALPDTLPNLTSIQGRTITLADAGADALLGWDDSASAYQNLSASDARTALALNTANSPQFAGIELSHASANTLTASSGVLSIEGVPLNPGIPVSDKSAAYTAVLTDRNTAIRHPAADNNARTFTIPANASVAYPVGTFLTFINEINTVTISITTDTLVLAGSGSTGSRSLAANGIATALKVASTRWYISGTGLT